MADPLINSRRSARASTYTPIHFADAADAVRAAGEGGDVINTAGLIRSVGIVAGELDELSKQATTEEARVAAKAIASPRARRDRRPGHARLRGPLRGPASQHRRRSGARARGADDDPGECHGGAQYPADR